MTNANEPINTVVEHTDGSTMRLSCTEIGLTKREYFAAMALQAVIQRKGMLDKKEDVAVTCVEYADELINALNETK